MGHKSKNLLKRFTSWFTSVAIVASTLVIAMPIPTVQAAAQGAISSATFNSSGFAAILVTFSEPVCRDADCTEALSVSNFVYTDGAGTAQTISSVVHTAGTNWALLVMSGAMDAGDTASTIRVEEVYTASGMIREDSALTTALTSDTTGPTISSKRLNEGNDALLLVFSEPVGDETGAALVNTDFSYTDGSTDSVSDLSAAAIHTSDRTSVILDLDANIAASDHTDGSDDSLTPVDNKIYDLLGNELTGAGVAITLDTFSGDNTATSTISSAYATIGESAVGGNDLILVNFAEPVFSNATHSAALASSDLAHSTGTISTLTHTAGDTFAVVDLSANLTALGTIDTTGPGNDDIFDTFGNAVAAADEVVNVTDNTLPSLRGVWINQLIDHASEPFPINAVGGGTDSIAIVTNESTDYPQEGSKMYKWTDATVVDGTDGFYVDESTNLYDVTNSLYEFTQVKFDLYYEDNSGSSGLAADQLQFVINDDDDLSTTASKWDIATTVTENSWTTITVDLTAAVDAGTALASQSASPQNWGLLTASTSSFDDNDVLYVDNIRFSRGANSKRNQIILEYSESVNLTGDPDVGSSGASASTAGDMTTSKTLAGMGAFASGSLTMPTTTNTVEKSTNGKKYSISLADRTGGLITTSSPTTLSGLFTPTATVTDISGNAMSGSATHTPETVIDALDLTTAATTPTNFSPIGVKSGEIDFSWTAASQTAATFSHYAVMYGTSSGVTVASTFWDDGDDATLATGTTATTTLTGLTDGTIYYAKLAGVDTKGIPTTLSSEQSILVTAATSTDTDTTASGVPSGVKASVNGDGHVVLTWTDPTDSDLKNIQIAKSKGTGVAPASILATVSAGIGTYTDTDVVNGDVVNYKLKSSDTTGNTSAYTSTISLTVGETVGEVSAVDPVTVNLLAQNESGQSGTATLTEENGQTTVTFALTGSPSGVSQPAHIHMGSCSELGAAKYTLTSVVDGLSTTVLDKTIAELTAELPLAINVHKSAEEASVYYSCGNILAETVAGGEEEDPVVAPEVDNSGEFPDTKAHWAKTEIATMAMGGIIKGNPDGTFKPDNNINRAEVAILLCRLAGNDDNTTSVNPFSDVMAGVWYGGCVSALKAMDVVKGNPDGTYKPTSDINRAEFLSLAMRLYTELMGDVEEVATTTAYTDLKTDWYTGTVATATKLGFVQGSTCGTGKCFYAEKSISRAEAATILYRMFKDIL